MQLALAYIPCKDEEEAALIAKAVLEKKLAACANILPQITSMYLDDEEVVCLASESILLLKHKISDFPHLRKYVIEIHSYDIPCVTQINLLNTNQEYLDWVEMQLKD